MSVGIIPSLIAVGDASTTTAIPVSTMPFHKTPPYLLRPPVLLIVETLALYRSLQLIMVVITGRNTFMLTTLPELPMAARLKGDNKSRSAAIQGLNLWHFICILRAILAVRMVHSLIPMAGGGRGIVLLIHGISPLATLNLGGKAVTRSLWVIVIIAKPFMGLIN